MDCPASSYRRAGETSATDSHPTTLPVTANRALSLRHSSLYPQLLAFIMSRRAKVFLASSIALTTFTVWGVHYLQEREYQVSFRRHHREIPFLNSSLNGIQSVACLLFACS